MCFVHGCGLEVVQRQACEMIEWLLNNQKFLVYQHRFDLECKLWDQLWYVGGAIYVVFLGSVELNKLFILQLVLFQHIFIIIECFERGSNITINLLPIAINIVLERCVMFHIVLTNGMNHKDDQRIAIRIWIWHTYNLFDNRVQARSCTLLVLVSLGKLT